jgi:pyruvate kinase
MPEGHLVLRRGDFLRLTRDLIAGRNAVTGPKGRVVTPAAIGCTLPQVFARVRSGDRVWLDDGRIGGVVRRADPSSVTVEITTARPEGEKLRGEKGINLPDTDLGLPALSKKDREDLRFIARHAHLVGLSFAQRPEDVIELQRLLRSLGRPDLGIVLKIETRRGFEMLPDLLLAAMRGEAVGVMIARGDLAVECGYERLAEVQEEILWLCEAAHLPVVWATQVLDGLARTGAPSRAEITDAAMGERAECVMLNKGPHILEAMRVLDDILRRMEEHQDKKSSRLRRLRWWEWPDGQVPPARPAPITGRRREG